MNVKGKKYTDRIVGDLRRDMSNRIKHVEAVAIEAGRSLSNLLRGFPQTYATKIELKDVRDSANAEISNVRNTASDLQVHTIGRDRFERFEEQVDEQLKTLSAQLGETSGRRTAIIGGAALLITIGALLFSTIRQSELTHADVSNQINQEAPSILRPVEASQDQRITVLERQVLVLQQQVAQIKALDTFFCRTRAAGKLPGC
jgi:hypothetical protein